MLVSLVRFQSSAYLFFLRSVGPLKIPHLAARSGSPSATALRPSLAAAGASFFARWGPFRFPTSLRARGSPSATALRRSPFGCAQGDSEPVERSLAAAG